MGLDAKDVGTLFWKILIFSTNTIYTYVTKHPFVSGVSAIIFLLYIFLPRLFYFVLYSSPLIACSAFYLRNHPSFKLLNIKTDDGLSPFSQKISEEETRKADLKHQRSVRRNARRKVEEVGKDWDSSQASEDERDKVILTTLYGNIPNTEKSPKLEKFKKDRAFLVSQDFSFEFSLDEETPSSTTGNVSVVDPSERLTSGGGETEIECSSSSEGEEEEETSREDKKVVAWTEDDQKNLMDLGNSEMERNKRLEHLITRRRMRRLVLLAAEGSLIDMEVPSICVGRNYFGLDQENYIVDGIQMPESAPSVLLPTKNPFDLPYDPQEEKPNLSGDSFQQEFAANPNDIFFCRHESFCRRVFPLGNQLDSKWEPWKQKSIDGWPRPQQGSNDGLVGEKHPLMKGKDLTRAEANDMESEHRTEIVMSDSNSLLTPGEREIDSNISNKADSSGKRNGDLRVENPLVGLVPRNTGSLSSSLAAERQRYMEHFGYSSRKGHKLSGESDLQVEFSEIGSPPTTVDGNNSSDEEKSLFVYDSDTEKEKSMVDRTAESQMLPAESVDQDFNETSSRVSPKSYIAKQVEGLSDGTDVNGRSEEEESSRPGRFPLDNSDRGSHIFEEATVPHINEVISKREEESQDLLQNSTDEMKISNDSDEPEPIERRTTQESEEHIVENDGDQSTQEMQELVEPEVSNVNHVTSDESATSPRSVLPDMLLPLDQTYTLTSESLELTSSDTQPRPVIPYPEPPQNKLGGDGNSRETEGQSEASEEATEEDSSANDIVPLSNTQKVKETDKLATKVKSPFKELFCKRENKPPLICGTLLQFFQQFTGINVVMFYAPVLFQTMGSGNNASLISTVVTNGVNALATIISIVMVDMAGRRCLLMEGAIQMTITQMTIGGILLAHLKLVGPITGHSVPLIVLILICVYVSGFAWSWGPLGWLVPSEIYPLEVRNAGYFCAVAMNMVCTFIIGQFFLSALCRFRSFLFFFFGAMNIIMGLFVKLCLPETKGVPIEEMAEKRWKTHPRWKKYFID